MVLCVLICAGLLKRLNTVQMIGACYGGPATKLSSGDFIEHGSDGN